MSAYAEQYDDLLLPEPGADYEEWAAALEGALPPPGEPGRCWRCGAPEGAGETCAACGAFLPPF